MKTGWRPRRPRVRAALNDPPPRWGRRATAGLEHEIDERVAGDRYRTSGFANHTGTHAYRRCRALNIYGLLLTFLEPIPTILGTGSNYSRRLAASQAQPLTSELRFA